MTNAQWFLLVGGLLLAMGLTSSVLKRLPVTSAIIYLAVGVLVGPTVLHLFHFNPLKESALLEVLTEAAALISLYAAGVKMPVPVSLARWRKGCARAMVADLHFHDLRREALTRLAAKVDVLTLAKISGHRDLRILSSVYYRPSMQDVADRIG